jgi:hypothetical protein
MNVVAQSLGFDMALHPFLQRRAQARHLGSFAAETTESKAKSETTTLVMFMRFVKKRQAR